MTILTVERARQTRWQATSGRGGERTVGDGDDDDDAISGVEAAMFGSINPTASGAVVDASSVPQGDDVGDGECAQTGRTLTARKASLTVIVDDDDQCEDRPWPARRRSDNGIIISLHGLTLEMRGARACFGCCQRGAAAKKKGSRFILKNITGVIWYVQAPHHATSRTCI